MVQSHMCLSSSIVVMALLQNTHSFQSYQTTTGHFSGIVEPIARMLATLPCRSQIRGEGMVELPTEHLLFLRGRRHSRNQTLWFVRNVLCGCQSGDSPERWKKTFLQPRNQRSAIVLPMMLIIVLGVAKVYLPFRPGRIRRAICACRACSSLLLRASEISL